MSETRQDEAQVYGPPLGIRGVPQTWCFLFGVAPQFVVRTPNPHWDTQKHPIALDAAGGDRLAVMI